MIINDQVFESYMLCKYKGFLKYNKYSETTSGYEKFHKHYATAYRERVQTKMQRSRNGTKSENTDMSSGNNLPKEGTLTFGVNVGSENLHSHIHAVEKIPQGPFLSKDSLIPYLFVPQSKFGKFEKNILAYSCFVLGKAKNQEVRYGKIVYSANIRTSRIDLSGYKQRTISLLAEIRSLSTKDGRPSIFLNKHCAICEFKKDCEDKAKDRDDLSLLRGLKEKKIVALNTKGIFTVTQYSYTFRPRRRTRRACPYNKKRYHNLQALAIRKQRTIVFDTPAIPTSSVVIYLDIETDPFLNLTYLIGLVVEIDGTVREYSFWADSTNEEESIIERFLQVVSSYDNFVLYHYGSIETRYLKSLKRVYNGPNRHLIDMVLMRSVNVLSLIYRNFYFPVYDNGLKSIAGYLGFRWSEEEPSGLNSIILRKGWENTGDSGLRKRLLVYNMEDCHATRMVVRHLSQLSSEALDGGDLSANEALNVDDLKLYDNKRLGKNEFLFDDLKYINDCAYFDYQRDRIYARTDKVLKRRLKRKSKRNNSGMKPNRTIEVKEIQHCPTCNSDKLHRRGFTPHTVVSLKFFDGGVKKWIIRYHQYRFRCLCCKKDFLLKQDENQLFKRYGHDLISWVLFENIIKRVSLGLIQQSIEEYFKLKVSRASLQNFKLYAAGYYSITYQDILKSIFEGNGVIYVDETPVKLMKSVGYVWVFTNTKIVAYMFRPTREGDFLRDYLNGFRGVLVSDFYGAYDSLNCMQQKCLIHLIRDMNDDLLNAPFDFEFRALVKSFGELLRKIVATIDAKGLKKRFLIKHERCIEDFFETILSNKYSSEHATKYQKRLRKNRDKMFTFIYHDGISWNNNSAEHAIKHFAAYRHGRNGVFTEKGLTAHLLLLSIYQTCEYKGLNFLEFLLSKRKSIP
jgi:predicted RecB family nuclease